MFLRCFFANNKFKCHVQNVDIWRLNVECADLISACDIWCHMLRANIKSLLLENVNKISLSLILSNYILLNFNHFFIYLVAVHLSIHTFTNLAAFLPGLSFLHFLPIMYTFALVFGNTVRTIPIPGPLGTVTPRLADGQVTDSFLVLAGMEAPTGFPFLWVRARCVAHFGRVVGNKFDDTFFVTDADFTGFFWVFDHSWWLWNRRLNNSTVKSSRLEVKGPICILKTVIS